mmetsp:Transcript_31411/g.75932  ORF Transcript_31411/g.75932 Transcript_31411/m.75932 type:complete len:672 (+) Transcript_31411:58-2073(+)
MDPAPTADIEEAIPAPPERRLVWSRMNVESTLVDVSALPIELRTAFESCKSDGDGIVTVSQLFEHSNPSSPPRASKRASKRVSIVLSLGKCQKIDIGELPEELRDSVKEYDEDGDGIITVHELMKSAAKKAEIKKDSKVLKDQNDLFKKAGIISFIVAVFLAALLIGVTAFVIYNSKDTYVEGHVATNKNMEPLSMNVNKATMSIGSLAFMPSDVAAQIRDVTIRGNQGEDIHLQRKSLIVKARERVILTTTDGGEISWDVARDGGRNVLIKFPNDGDRDGGEWTRPAGCESCTAVSITDSDEVRAALGEFNEVVGLPEDGRRLDNHECDPAEVPQVNQAITAVQAPQADTQICPENFYLKPEDVPENMDMREIFLLQFKPCGYYQKYCSNMTRTWFPDLNDNERDPFDPLEEGEIIRANVDYPGENSEVDIKYGITLVEFDIGLDNATYQSWLSTTYDFGGKNMLDSIEGENQYLDIGNRIVGQNANVPLWTSPARPLETGEHCVETFAKLNDDWSANYASMGTCGGGHIGVGYAKDCMKHDVCSYFKALALGTTDSSGNLVSEGFCRDFDCGDEAAQTVLNCLEDSWGALNTQQICQEDIHLNSQNNGNYFSALHSSARFPIGQAEECTFRTGWDKNQGMPSQRYVAGTTCFHDDQCISNSCSLIFGCA